MKKLRKLMALLLCMIMMIPSQGMIALAEMTEAAEGIEIVEEEIERIEGTERLEEIEGTERISETRPLEMLEGAAEETERIEEMLALDPMKKVTPDEGIIYWNPGGVLPEDLATASNALAADSDVQTATASNAPKATASNAKKGSDNADGRTPSTPVKTLAKAIERAEELMEEEGLLTDEITIYAMNPMEVADGQLYALNGGNLNIKSWPGRSYDSDVIFYVNGGQLTMMNTRLASGNPEREEEEARLIYVRGGVFQMGQKVTLEGRVVMDYRSEAEETEWEMATAADAVVVDSSAADSDTVDSDTKAAAESGTASFDMDEYILDNDEDSIELLEDRMSASTWRDPIIELLDGFDGGAGEFFLELLEDDTVKEIALVKTLYSDGETEEEFLGFFTLVDSVDTSWCLQVETQETAQVRDTGTTDGIGMRTLSLETEILTQKTLVATRLGGKTVFWNPGGNINIGGVIYNAGQDSGFDGSTPDAPVKTWERALYLAEGGTIICMQTLDLVASNAGDYLPTEDGGATYLLKSSSTATMAALSGWTVNPQPAIRVPAGKTLVLQDVELVGLNGTSAPAIDCNKGDIIIQENVTADIGYIQITAFRGMGAPVKVTSTDTDYDGDITLFFNGINNSYDYCYTDVVIPHGALADSIASAGNSDEMAASVGAALLDRFQLHPSHRDEMHKGDSRFDWILRQDTAEDDSIENAQNLELYAIYYFDAIYLDGVNGDNSNYGATCQYPVKTWAKAQERWAYEMKKSVDARWAAIGSKSAAEIEESYPIPKTIYICGTVTVEDTEVWDLWAEYLSLDPLHRVDYDGSAILTKVEVVPHMDISNHVIPQTLVEVTGAGNVTIKDVTFRNMTDDAASVTIQVEAGGSLTLTGSTLLTGKRLAQAGVAAKEVTLGTHVRVSSTATAYSTFVMDENWAGAIEKRQHGVNASGSGTKVTMDSGSIQENNSFEQTRYDAGDIGHKPGAGVLLSAGAEFTMNGGKITKNTVYQYGAGVYMEDADTTFVMNRGEISDNKMYTYRASGTSSTVIRGQGIGVYAGTGTVLKLGDETNDNPASDVKITRNTGHLADGVGVWCDGKKLTIHNATISENYAGGSISSNTCYGVGLYVGTNAALEMEGGKIIGNYTSTSAYGSAFGAGIYIAYGQASHSIKRSEISGNLIGYEYGSTSSTYSYSRGGGIYLDGGKLTIEDSIISENRAAAGGGICSYVTSSTRAAELTIKETRIEKNNAQAIRSTGYGYGGGIYLYYYGTLRLEDGTRIINNETKYYGGGIYLAGSGTSNTHLYMMAETAGAIEISGNVVTGSYGGGIYQTSSSIHAKNTKISENKAPYGGGIYTNSDGYYSQVEISKNEATYGGGIYATSSNNYLKDCAVTDNKADTGGGFYLNSTSAYVYLSETTDGDFKLTGNHAETGGGIRIANGSRLYVNIAGEIQNSANEQGSNLYLSGYGHFYLLGGKFKQPELADRQPGVYNIYIDDTSVTAYERCFDWTSVTAESKKDLDPEGAHEVIYLNTGNSYLMSLIDPPNAVPASFPIDVNMDVFKIGSVVVKPAYMNSVPMQEPNSALDYFVAAPKTYNTRLINAAVNTPYISGGILPRRTHLEGFRDSNNDTRTNVILVGEGVYLSGEDGDDIANNGTSPADAVKTFERAKEILEERISQTASDEASKPDDKKMGYAPFIYICGKVDILSNETWELNYNATLYTETNKYYKISEKAAAGEVGSEAGDSLKYDAQVRRFASFVKKPMVNVGNGSSAVSFETREIIINGMAEAVVLSDQGLLSPIIKGNAKSKVTLTGESQIANNYNNGLDINEELIITGEVGETNKQVYNHHGHFIRVGASGEVNMVKEGRIYADDTIEKVGTIAPYGIRAIGADVKITMSGNSAIIQESGSLLGYGSSSYGIYTDQSKSSIKMSEKASIENHAAASYLYYGICIAGSGSSLEMSDDANITAVDASIYYNIYALGTNTTVTMKDRSNITQLGTRTISNYGIFQQGTDTVITMLNSASIAGTYVGIWMGGTRPRVEMKNHAQIYNGAADTLTTTYGIQLYTTSPSSSTVTDPTIVMTENASIHGSATKKMSRAIYAALSSYEIRNLTVEMNMNVDVDADEENSASLYNCTSGYYLSSVSGASLSMGEEASITADTYGYYQTSYYSSTNNFSFLMRGNSRIAKSTYGMYFTSSILVPVNITLKDKAAIEQNTHGIYEYASGSYGLAKLDLQMSDKSRISGNSQYGIYLQGQLAFTETNGYYHNITLNNSAMIGGDSFYNPDVAASGNNYSGIYANSPIRLVMNDSSKISWNGSTTDSNNSVYSNGIYLTRYQNVNYYRAGTASITLNKNAEICNNRGSVYIATIASDSYPNPCEIVLNGILADGTTLSAPSIHGNTDAVFLGTQATLKLQGGAVLGGTTYETSSYLARALDCYGYLELDGRSTVSGTIYLQNGQRPITMTHEGPNSMQQPYDLHLVEGFIGQIVVKPGGSMTDVTAPNQISYFNKLRGEGMAADRPLMALSRNIVLLGENNVYLSGNGDDTNSGNSPSTPVRTFKRAKKLLETEGYFERDANIIICKGIGSGTGTVNVLAGDDDWSFGTGGMVTNAGSGHTWKPMVIRASDYNGVLITLVGGTSTTYASTVTFKNITIDGGAAERSLATAANDWLLAVEYNKKAVLGEGAVLQNNKAVTTTYSDYSTLGVYVYGGTLEIDGGTITGMERRTSYNNTNARYFSSAITCRYYSNATYPGKVIMKSGQIVDNTIDATDIGSESLLGAIYLNAYCTFDMSGGLIFNNTVNSRTTSPCYGGAIVNQQGDVTISGGIIRANQGGRGSAVYCNGTNTTFPGNLTLSGGQITGNTMSAAGFTAKEAYSPVYINGYSFQLKGGGADIQDGIYLATTNSIITISGQINQTNRRYRVYLNQGTTNTQFKKGSVVVRPDGNYVTDTTPYLSYFDVRTHTYVLDQGRVDQAAGVNQSAVVAATVKENQCLILMKAVFLDSVKGSDASSNNGLTPATAVKSFGRAKTIGAAPDSNGTTDSYNHYIIYVSGRAFNEAADRWTLPKFAYMCRYTGFAVYTDTSGTVATGDNRAYYGVLIEPKAELTLQDIAIYGRRTMDAAVTCNGDSLVRINSGIEARVETGEFGVILADNNNMGAYMGEQGIENLTSKGGAFHVAAGGVLRMEDGVIRNTEAADGSAIYLGASAADQSESGRGRLILTGTPAGSPNVSGKVYLGGTGTLTAAYIEPDASYQPSTALQISIGNDYSGRPVIQYPAGITPGAEELKQYLFDDAIKAMYDVVSKAYPNSNIFELNMRDVIYLDGQNGDDENGHDGSTPEKAYRTLRKVYESIGTSEDKYGIVVFVVDTVEVSGDGGGPSWIEIQNVLVKEDNGNSHYEGYYTEVENAGDADKIKVWGQVYFNRYAQPKGGYSGFEPKTLEGTLFDVKDGGTLTMRGIYLDGHSQNADNSNPTLVAEGVEALSPLVTVGEGGTLYCLRAGGSGNLASTATLFTNNFNVNDKYGNTEKIINPWDSSDPKYEGSSAGIELLVDGKCHLEYTEFSNLQLGGNVIVGGTDVYSNGELCVSMDTYFTGTVYLEGFGTADERQDTSRYITIEAFGTPVRNNFQVMMRDPYMGRTVVVYPEMRNEETGNYIEPPLTHIGYYRLEENRVKDYFCLNKRSGTPYIFELQVPIAVYIDGIGGDDGTDDEDPVGRLVGSTPEYPVKTLKRAFDLLRTRGGNTIYVVNRVEVRSNIQVTGMSYVGTGEETVLLGNTSKVKITRYIQPDFAFDATGAVTPEAIEAGYGVPDFRGVLLTVKNGAVAEFSKGVYFDGHSEPKINTDRKEYADGAVVSRESTADAPMITVASGGTLTLSEGTTLQDNNNIYAGSGTRVTDTTETGKGNGGAIANSGTVKVNGALFTNNKAVKGSVVYQDGTFNIQSKPENLKNHDNAFYLTTVNSGTTEAPVWGTDHVIRTAVAIPDEMIESLAFDVDMDHAVKNRPVVEFTDSSAYSPNTNADAEHEHFKLGTVPETLFLVVDEVYDYILELQNWEILKVEVPEDIYLAVRRRDVYDSTNKLLGIKGDPLSVDLFSAPEYKISNKGDYDAKVSITGFENKTRDERIKEHLPDTSGSLVDVDLMNLTVSAAAAMNDNDLYLAVKGLDDVTGGSGFGFSETSLQPYADESMVTAAPLELGLLKAGNEGNEGNFTFVGAVGSGFVSKYMDPSFQIAGLTVGDVQKKMDGRDGGVIHARAKYLLKYKVEIDPSRRENPTASGSAGS